MPPWNAVSIAILMLFLAGSVLAEKPAEPPITADDREHWSFKPVEQVSLPEVNDSAWCRTGVDRFILAELESRNLQPMPEADRLTLLRRVTFDLTGLPPTVQDIRAFESDRQPGAYERVVDRLLGSAAYGERWGQHWLDLARFAETDGFEHDKLRPNAWRYRDWVIQALNDDLPYDEFVRLQLAGDELHPDDPQAAIATGFLLCGPDMPDINLQQERRHNFLNDMTGTVGSVFLGLQMACAACHDHKYDPISQRDFYRLRAFFEPANVFGEHEIPTPAECAAISTFERDRATQWKALDAEIKQLRNENSVGSKEQLKKREAELAELKKAKPPAVTMGRVVQNPRQPADPARLWIRGDFRRPGPELEPAFVRVVDRADDQRAGLDRPSSQSGVRTALADWLVDSRHPLTARVMVNRLWQHHFGEGLVESASDFGVMGDWPTHPELLDWLAAEFIDQGWSLKSMHRLLVTSSVYRTMSHPPTDTSLASGGRQPPDASNPSPHAQSRRATTDSQNRITKRWEQLTTDDPNNYRLGRMRRQRLDGEAIRDAMLAAAGQLNLEASGPGIRPPLAPEVTSTLLKNQWPVTENPADFNRRSAYLFVRRNLPYPLFAVFDRPDTNQSCPRRNQTTIAPQALHLLNSEFAFECAESLADRLVRESSKNSAERIELAYRLTLSRPPDDQERQIAEQFLADGDENRLIDFCLGLFNLNEFVYVD